MNRALQIPDRRELNDEFFVRVCFWMSPERLAPGTEYVFAPLVTDPAAGKMIPWDREHAGQIVAVVREIEDDQWDGFPLLRVAAADGTEGVVSARDLRTGR